MQVKRISASGRIDHRRPLLAMSLILLAFFLAWCQDLGYPSLSGDESFVAILSTRPASEILERLNQDEPHPPLYYLAMRAWQSAAGVRPEFLVRFPSLLNGLLLLSLAYRLGRDLGLRWTAAVAGSLVVGLNPQMTLHLREARMYGPMVASLAVMALAALRFDRLPRRLGVGLAAAATLAPLLTHYFNALFVPAVSAWGVVAYTGSARRRWIASQAIAWIVFAVWLPTMGRGFFNPTSLSEAKTWSFTLPPWENLARLATVGVWGYRDAPADWLGLAGGALFVGAWLAGGLLGRGRRRWLLLLGVAAPLTAYALLGWFKPVFHPKYMLPWLLFAALAVARLIDLRPRLGVAWSIALAALMIAPAWRTLRLLYDPGFVMSRNEWLRPVPREMSRFLVAHMGPNDIFGLGTPDAAHCYYAEHYFDRSLGCALIPQYPTQTPAELEAVVDALLSSHQTLWYLDFYNPDWDPNRVADRALAGRAISLGEEPAAGNTLRLYASADSLRRGARAVDATFGGVARLDGVWTLAAGQLHVVLSWRALADRPAVFGKVFVHVVDAAGQIVAQQDGVPVWWTRPLSTWRLGERLLDAYSMPLPEGFAPGGSSIRVGLYDPDTLDRFPATDPSGARLPDDALSLPLTAAPSASR